MAEAKDSKCVAFGKDCTKDEHSECKEFFLKYCKLVFCRDSRCAWNQAISQKKFVKHHRDHIPFKHDAYTGVCGRPELALDPQTIQTIDRKYVLATCSVRSDKGVRGHLDFARLLQPNKTPYGGNIPDPVEPGAAYH